MKISLIGTRGIPAKYGGYETFAEEISPLLASEGFDVSVQCDYNSYHKDTFKGVKLFFSSVSKSDHRLRYYFQGIRWGINNSDILLVASVAGSFFYFLNIFKRKIIITNTDGLEYKRKKWPLHVKVYFKLAEWLAVKFSDYLVADSEEIKKHLCRSYPSVEKKIRVIEYGSEINGKANTDILDKYSLKHNDYYLVVCRLEPENNLDMIIEGFKRSKTDSPLVIVGNLLDTKYIKYLISTNNSERVKFIGGIYDKNELYPIRYSCKAYIHGHSVGGTNPSLLEAMGSRNIILAHDNQFNREVTKDLQFYFKTAEDLSGRIENIELLDQEEAEKYKEISINRIRNKYNWDNILQKYLNLFDEVKITK